MARSAGASPGAGDGGLRVENLEKRYPDGTLIGPLGFTVAPGEFFSLLGPSGCGKTTTLKCIAGIETPTAGTIHLGARDLMAMPANRRPVGIVFQNLALFPHLTVASNIAFGLKLRKLPAREIDRKVRAIAEQVEVTDLLDRMPSEISGGQQQRAAIARSLVLEPELLLLDEPLSALDAKLRQNLRAQLKALQKRTGITFVYVTHDQSEALSMSDRIAVFNRGSIEQIGRPGEIYKRPATPFVADFIGEGNMLSRDPLDARTLRTAGGGRIAASAAPESAERTLFVRPECLAITPVVAANAGDDSIFYVAHLFFEGATTRIVVHDAQGHAVMVYRANGDDASRMAEGAAVRLSVDAKHLIAFAAC
jgi:ABC-type Fe3+/spermidine/putrescine transport system ATPase subunit